MVPVRRRFGSVVAVSTIPAARAVHLLSACMPVEMGVARAPASEEIGAEASAERPRCAWSRPTQSAPRASTFLAVALIRAFSWFVQVAACCIVVRTRRCSLTRRLLSQQTLALSRRLPSRAACHHAPLPLSSRKGTATELSFRSFRRHRCRKHAHGYRLTSGIARCLGRLPSMLPFRRSSTSHIAARAAAAALATHTAHMHAAAVMRRRRQL